MINFFIKIKFNQKISKIIKINIKNVTQFMRKNLKIFKEGIKKF